MWNFEKLVEVLIETALRALGPARSSLGMTDDAVGQRMKSIQTGLIYMRILLRSESCGVVCLCL